MTHSRVPAPAILLTAFLPAIAAWVYFHAVSSAVVAAAVYAATKLFTVLWPWIASRVWHGPPAVARRCRRTSLLWGVGIGLIGSAGVVFLYRGPLAHVTISTAPAIAAKVEALGIGEHYVAFALFLSLVHSAIEEVYWRWFLFGNLHPRSQSVSALVAATAFSAHHFLILAAFTTLTWTLVGGLLVGVAGWAWCVLYQRSGSLLGPWVSHVLIDLAVMWVGWDLIQHLPT